MQEIKLLIDDNIAAKLMSELNIPAAVNIKLTVNHVRDFYLVTKYNQYDPDILSFAKKHQYIIVTCNGKDFVKQDEQYKTDLIWIRDGNLPQKKQVLIIQAAINSIINDKMVSPIMIEMIEKNNEYYYQKIIL